MAGSALVWGSPSVVAAQTCIHGRQMLDSPTVCAVDSLMAIQADSPLVHMELMGEVQSCRWEDHGRRARCVRERSEVRADMLRESLDPALMTI